MPPATAGRGRGRGTTPVKKKSVKSPGGAKRPGSTSTKSPSAKTPSKKSPSKKSPTKTTRGGRGGGRGGTPTGRGGKKKVTKKKVTKKGASSKKKSTKSKKDSKKDTLDTIAVSDSMNNSSAPLLNSPAPAQPPPKEEEVMTPIKLVDDSVAHSAAPARPPEPSPAKLVADVETKLVRTIDEKLESQRSEIAKQLAKTESLNRTLEYQTSEANKFKETVIVMSSEMNELRKVADEAHEIEDRTLAQLQNLEAQTNTTVQTVAHRVDSISSTFTWLRVFGGIVSVVLIILLVVIAVVFSTAGGA